MKPVNHTKKIIFLAFLLSLLFHLSSVIYVAIQNNNQKTILSPEIPIQSELQQKINKQQQQNEWVETKARAGNFGTPVYFQDDFEEEIAPQEQPTEPISQEPQSSFVKTSEDKQEKEEITEPVIPKEKNEATEDRPTSITTEHEPKPLPQKKITRSSSNYSQPSFAKASSFAEATKDRSAGGPKPPITLSQLTQGFLNHVKNEGNHAIHMLGKKNGTPSDEQMKYERYLQKLSWCLQNSFNIHNNRFPPSANMNDSVQVLLSLNQDGSLKHCHISKTSGNRDLDHFTIFIFKDASTSFPPVPQYLPHDPFTINYIIMVSTSEENRWKLYRQ